MDGICYEFYKNAPSTFVHEILTVLNHIFIREDIPSSFKTSVLIPLLKKGDPNCPSNYRGLSLIDTLYKIFTNIILNRLIDWADRFNILNEYQAGFRKNYSTTDNIFNLVNLVNLNKLNGKKTYAFFVDFSSAFDLIPRNSLFYKLSCMGLSSKIIRLLQLLYKNTTSKIYYSNTYSNTFKVNVGVKQGCILSPFLFALYLNDLNDSLPGGVTIDNIRVKILLYADDIVLLSDSPTQLQQMIDSLFNYCQTWSLKVNLSKSKILIFRNGTRIPNNSMWNFGTDIIEIVNCYKYLGMDLTYNLSFKKHLQNKLSTAKMAISSTWSKFINNPSISNYNKLKIFYAAARSILLYGAQIWGFLKYEDVEKLYRFFIKKMLFLPKNTPNYMLFLETGLNSLFLDTLKLHFKYINRALLLPNTRLPRIIVEKIINRNTYWFEEWTKLAAKINFIPDNNRLLCHHWKQVLHLVKESERNEFVTSARGSQFHDLYSELDYNLAPLPFTYLSSYASSLIIRARGGLLDLNSRPFRNTSDGLCTLCNLDACENTLHFIGVCPLYKKFRLKYFDKSILSPNEVINLLNGYEYSFDSLFKYLETSLKLRRLIIDEFN